MNKGFCMEVSHILTCVALGILADAWPPNGDKDAVSDQSESVLSAADIHLEDPWNENENRRDRMRIPQKTASPKGTLREVEKGFRGQ